MPWGGARGQNVLQIRLSIWKIVVEIYASRCCCHRGKEQRVGAFAYFVHMSSFSFFSVIFFFFLLSSYIFFPLILHIFHSVQFSSGFLARLSISSGWAIVITLCPSSIIVRCPSFVVCRQQLVWLRGHNFDTILIKLGQNVCLYEI